MLERLDATKAADLAEFHRPRSWSLARAFLGIGGFLAIIVTTPALLMFVHPLGGLVGFPLGYLLAVALAASTPTGRGALWEYGRGRSPAQSVRYAVLFLGLVLLFITGMLLWGPWSRQH